RAHSKHRRQVNLLHSTTHFCRTQDVLFAHFISYPHHDLPRRHQTTRDQHLFLFRHSTLNWKYHYPPPLSPSQAPSANPPLAPSNLSTPTLYLEDAAGYQDIFPPHRHSIPIFHSIYDKKL